MLNDVISIGFSIAKLFKVLILKVILDILNYMYRYKVGQLKFYGLGKKKSPLKNKPKSIISLFNSHLENKMFRR